MKVQEVFTPGDYPEYTYVEREHGQYEEDLKFDLQRGSTIVSISDPSKSGKSMLLNNVINDLDYNLVTVHGSNIKSVSDLWNNTLDQLDAPKIEEISEGSEDEVVKEGQGGVDVPGLKATGGGRKHDRESDKITETHTRKGLSQIIESVNLDRFVLFIDDAHYIDEENQHKVAEAIKEAYERGLTICVAYIPYRSDSLTRKNPDLSGRVESMPLEYWEEDDLDKIAEKGFKKLKYYPQDIVLKNLSRESVGSPHLMQKLCLEMCKELGIHEKTEEMTPLDASMDDIRNVLRKTGNKEDYTSTYEIISGGASKGGGERNQFNLKGLGNKGDLYDAILCAIASNPPKLSLDQSKLIGRVDDLCIGDRPQSGNITQALQRMDKWMSDFSDDVHVFEWDDDRKTLEIPDPYLIFYLRWSDRMDMEPNLI